MLMTLSGMALLIASGCRSQKETASSPVDVPETFSDSGTQIIPEKWWTAFDDESLDAVVDRALHANFSLLTAWQRLHAARAVADRESSFLLPDLEASLQGQVNGPDDGSGQPASISPGLSSVYEIDLWGRIRSGAEAERYRARATLSDYRTAALTLSAEIARTWYQLADAQSQRELIGQQVETNLTVLELLTNRFETGQIQGVDVLRQQQLVEATREQQAHAESRVKVLEHQLAVLLGRPPGSAIAMTPDNLPELPPQPAAGIPIDLIRRRPDVESAFLLMQAADRDLASAISNQYPRLTLSASVSPAGDHAGSLFEDWALSLAGNLVAPIFYGGRLSAEVDRSEAVRQQRLYEYSQTVLTAFREVEDALIRENKQSESIQYLDRQVELASRAYEQLRVQYLNGSGNYLDVLTALDGIQQLRRDHLSARLTLVEFRIALYRSLAGSFETENG
ncbi:MAG: TolC family protein [Balneolales bacterium]